MEEDVALGVVADEALGGEGAALDVAGEVAQGDLSLNLRINGKRRYRRRSKIGRREKIPNRVNIEERPMMISGRNR